MDAITTDFGEVLLWSFWFFIWIAALVVWFRCLWDLFGDKSLSGWAKAGWAVLLIFVPWLGALDPFRRLSSRNWIPDWSATLPISPSRASISRTR